MPVDSCQRKTLLRPPAGDQQLASNMLDDLSTRRLFLQRGLTLLAAGGTIPTFLDNTALAMMQAADGARTQAATGKNGKILVIVQLSGGNDGLNTVVPYADDAYHRARPALAHKAADVLKINDYIGLHPNLAPVKELFDDDMMAIVQGVGYPNPNRSHFRSMDIWHSAEPEHETPTNGWLGRFFDNTCDGTDPHSGVNIGDSIPLAMRGSRVTPLSFEKPENYKYAGRDRAGYERVNGIGEGKQHIDAATSKKQIEVATADEQLQFLTRTAMDAQVSSDNIQRIAKNYQTSSRYPGGEFGQGLRTIAAMIAGQLPTRVYYVSLGGFDTHANQRGRHEQLLQQFAAGVSAFWKDMKRQENEDRVLMMTFSEFGRRVDQNASGGTDHGAAAPMFFFGKSVKGGVIGKHPSLTQLDQGDLRYHIDFREAYASVLQQWMDAPSKPILGQQFKPLQILRA
ncbi:MAG TPA: DUF1501 domain-containing protein [Tepidisphaeraceae bacterium]|nr:DUF1501 domain-containing protein [Tepidisphaeraceae bacterium]